MFVRIVTWNLHNGGGVSSWPRLQAALSADLVLLQESPRPDWRGGCAWQCVAHGKWGSAVLAAKGQLRTIPIAGYDGWVVGGELAESGLNRSGRPLFVFSVHAPKGHMDQPNRPYVENVICILNQIHEQLPTDADAVIGGDFNFRSLGLRREDESIQTTKQEREALARITELGLVSCWTAAHPGRPLAQTLRHSSDQALGRTTPYHCDGILVPASWCDKITCEVLTSAAWEVSDHYPVAAWIAN